MLQANPYRADSSWASLLQRLPASVQEVVDMSPSLTSDGAVVLGTRQTTVMLVDPVSGRVIRSFGQDGNSSKTLAAPGAHSLMSLGMWLVAMACKKAC